jgi:SAM-dependent methyltransferase
VSAVLERLGRRFARFVTTSVVARPGLWRLLRRPLRSQFEHLAPVWDKRRGPETMIPLGVALDRLATDPQRILDLGTGTGAAARVVARRFPEAAVVGVDLAPKMVDEARALLPADLGDRVRYEVGDASSLDFEPAAFDLVVLLNMIPFFEELARVTAPRGTVLFAFSSGAGTPIYVPTEKLRERLEPLGFEEFEELAAGPGTAVLARRAES